MKFQPVTHQPFYDPHHDHTHDRTPVGDRTVMPQSLQQTVTARLKEAEILRRKIAGQSFRVIAAELGMSVGGAHDAFKRAMAATVLPVQLAADELRAVIRERLDADLEAIEERRANGDPDAIRTHLAIIKAQRELEGLDAEQKIIGDITVRYEVVGVTDLEVLK